MALRRALALLFTLPAISLTAIRRRASSACSTSLGLVRPPAMVGREEAPGPPPGPTMLPLYEFATD
jgi:hypothetical protein